ncbi:hypothetical protein FH972_024573 [Carpinus fangiana]|uniref:Uncharacterized protein n=1 Tax=Carpinus fangiana TaxID=176857 RepID=A0A5N6KYD2_9ROSI|nr:hypothetical protein FH972_024573 [Carpinus fangiana]
MNQSQAAPAPSRRSPSNSSGVPVRKNSDASSLARSTSSRSGGDPSSYVALMRKQKATVWSDRAQHEDPRMRAAMAQAKMRAHMEVSGLHNGRLSTSGTSSLTGGVRSKIRHHGAVKAQQYAPTTHPAHGVPMRLSAREVDESDSEDERSQHYHQRSGSGRSSFGSAGRSQSMYGLQQPTMTSRSSSSNTPPQTDAPPAPQQQQTTETRNRADTRGSMWSEGAEPTPVPGRLTGADYFSQAPSGSTGEQTASSSNSEREEASFGGVGQLPLRQRDPQEQKLDLAELRRRGSVDERSMTMSGPRLFVANPDSDSD